MRITSGSLRHRIIKMTNLDTTRETQDKVRMAIFNMLGQYFDGGIALDLFAGSGAMGLEAISRGMDMVVFNDINSDACKIVKENIDSLNIKNYELYNKDYVSFLKSDKHKYDYIFLDPPYALNDIDYILSLAINNLKPNGLIIFEMAKESKYSDKYQVIKEKSYGIKKVIIFKGA